MQEILIAAGKEKIKEVLIEAVLLNYCEFVKDLTLPLTFAVAVRVTEAAIANTGCFSGRGVGYAQF